MLVISENTKSSLPILPEDTYTAICNMLVDIGDQYSEKYDKYSRKVLIGWELPDEKLDNGETRRMTATYTMSLSSKGNLRKDLISWRGRDFTVDELKAFNLKSIVGVPCMLSVVHKTTQDGNKYAIVGGIMKLPKGMVSPEPTVAPVVYDLDSENAMTEVENLPEWIQKKVKESKTWTDMLEKPLTAAEEQQTEPTATFADEVAASEAELPF